MAPFPRPLHAPLHARPLSLPFSPFPPPGPAIIRSSIPGARPLSHSVRPAAAPVSPCAAAPFPSLFTIPRASFAKKRCPRRCGAPRDIPACAAGLTRRGYGPGFRACVARFCGLPRAGGDEDGGATVAAGHKTGLPRGRGAGIRRNGRQNRQAGLPRAVGGGGRTLPRPTVFCKKEETRHRGFARAALHESGRGCEYYRRGE